MSLAAHIQTGAGGNFLLAEYSDWFEPYLSGATETNRLKSDIVRRLRLHRMAEDKQHNYFVLDGNFEHFYYLPSDHHGEFILQLLCDSEQRAVLDDILSQNLAPCRPSWVVENDAMDGEYPVLFV